MFPVFLLRNDVFKFKLLIIGLTDPNPPNNSALRGGNARRGYADTRQSTATCLTIYRVNVITGDVGARFAGDTFLATNHFASSPRLHLSHLREENIITRDPRGNRSHRSFVPLGVSRRVLKGENRLRPLGLEFTRAPPHVACFLKVNDTRACKASSRLKSQIESTASLSHERRDSELARIVIIGTRTKHTLEEERRIVPTKPCFCALLNKH